jgi:hypothetical protein
MVPGEEVLLITPTGHLFFSFCGKIRYVKSSIEVVFKKISVFTAGLVNLKRGKSLIILTTNQKKLNLSNNKYFRNKLQIFQKISFFFFLRTSEVVNLCFLHFGQFMSTSFFSLTLTRTNEWRHDKHVAWGSGP